MWVEVVWGILELELRNLLFSRVFIVLVWEREYRFCFRGIVVIGNR